MLAARSRVLTITPDAEHTSRHRAAEIALLSRALVTFKSAAFINGLRQSRGGEAAEKQPFLFLSLARQNDRNAKSHFPAVTQDSSQLDDLRQEVRSAQRNNAPPSREVVPK